MNRHCKNTTGRYGGKTWVVGKLVEAMFGFGFWGRFWGTPKGNKRLGYLSLSPCFCVGNRQPFWFHVFHFFWKFTKDWTQSPPTSYKEGHPNCPHPGTWRRTGNMNSKTGTLKHGRRQAHPYCPFAFWRYYPCSTGLEANGRFDRP